MGANDSKHCDGDVGDSQGMCAPQAEGDEGGGKRRRAGRRERSLPARFKPRQQTLGPVVHLC